MAQRPIATQLFSYGAVGTVNTVVDVVMFFVLVSLSTHAVAANTLAWLSSMVGSYVMNSLSTFADQSGGKLRLRDFLLFFAIALGGFAASTVALIVAMPVAPLWLAKGAGVIVSFLITFVLARTIVFKAGLSTARKRDKEFHNEGRSSLANVV